MSNYTAIFNIMYVHSYYVCVSSCVVVIIIIRTWVVLVCELQFYHNPGYIIIQLSPGQFNWHPIVYCTAAAHMSRCSNTTLHNLIPIIVFVSLNIIVVVAATTVCSRDVFI